MTASLATRRVVSRTSSVVSDPAGERVAVVDDVRNSVAIVEGTSLRVLARVPIARSFGVVGSAQEPRTGLVYLVGTGSVSVVDPVRARVVREASFATPSTLGDVSAVAVGGGRLWIATSGAGLLILDIERLQVVGRIEHWPGGNAPTDVVIDPGRSLAYVAFDDRLAVIDTASYRLIRCLRTSGRLALDPARNLLYLASAKDDGAAALRVIDATSMRLVAIVRGGLVPVDVELDPRTGRLFVVDAGAYNIETVQADAGLVWVVDTRTNRLLRTVAIGISPMSAALSAGASVMFIITHQGTLARLPLTRSAR